MWSSSDRWMTLTLQIEPMISCFMLQEAIWKSWLLSYKTRQKRFCIWFTDNQMNATPDKRHFTCSSKERDSLIENEQLKNGTWGKLLGIKIQAKLFFNAHIGDICKKAGLKLNTLVYTRTYERSGCNLLF